PSGAVCSDEPGLHSATTDGTGSRPIPRRSTEEPHMSNARTRIAALLAVAALALTACSGGTAEPDAASEPASTAPAATSGADGESSEPADPAAAGQLIGMVGTADDPEAYEIALLDG